jgi:hypothetical protein
MSSLVQGDYSFDTIPDDVRMKTVVDQILHVDVLDAGEMAGTGLNTEQSSDLGKIKNHWEGRVQICSISVLMGLVLLSVSVHVSASVLVWAPVSVSALASTLSAFSLGVCRRRRPSLCQVPARSLIEKSRFTFLRSVLLAFVLFCFVRSLFCSLLG